MNSIDELFPAENGDTSENIDVGEKDVITAVSATLKEISDGNQKTLNDITSTFTETLKNVVKKAKTEFETEAGTGAGTETETEAGVETETETENN